MSIAIISGTSLAESELFLDWSWYKILTPWGSVFYRKQRGMVLLNRHGPEGKIPPHSINHRANIQALQRLGVTHVLSFNSVGSLREDLAPGTLVSCSDYLSFAPATFSDLVMKPTVPRIENNLLEELEDKLPAPVTRDQVYVHTRGPRFETRAEVRVLRGLGDVVGMTLAHEADLCTETDISLTSLAMVDNFANGIAEDSLGPDQFASLVQANRKVVDEVFRTVVDAYGEPV